MSIVRSMGTAGGALAYLVKRLYSMDQLAMSTLAENSKKDLEQLPPDEINAIKGMHNKTICLCFKSHNFTVNKTQRHLLSHNSFSLMLFFY